MREIVVFIASLSATVVMTAVAVVLKPESPVWKWLLGAGIAALFACSVVLLVDLLKPGSDRLLLTGIGVGLALLITCGIGLYFNFPLTLGFLYLIAVMDWSSRAVLSWRLSNTMDAGFCVEAVEAALADFGTPEIFNTDQGSQFTGEAFTGVLLKAGIAISMDGRGRWMDNVFIERLWRSLKHEEVYLKGYADAREARAGIGQWIAFYNELRPHQALGHAMPMAAWRAGMSGSGCRASAVDMPLCLDNADALSTSPQRLPKQDKDAFWFGMKRMEPGWEV